MADPVQCECGRITGVRCAASAVRADRVAVVEYMPEQHRASHEAAGNRGVYPHNGAERIYCDPDCAASLVESDPEWISLVEG